MNQIRKEFDSCNKFIAVDLPPISIDEGTEVINSKTRLKSINKLETTLNSYNIRSFKPEISSMTKTQVEVFSGNLLQEIAMFTLTIVTEIISSPKTWVLDHVLGSLMLYDKKKNYMNITYNSFF